MPSGAGSTSDAGLAGKQQASLAPRWDNSEACPTYPQDLSGMEPQLPTAVSGHHRGCVRRCVAIALQV